MRTGRLSVRDAEPADAPLLAAFAAHAFTTAFAPDNDPHDVAQYVAEAFSVARIAGEITDERSTFLLAYEADAEQFIGYAHLRAGAPDVPLDAHAPTELVRIYVDPELVGHGYGSALLRVCLDRASAEHDVLWLGVWEHNEGARRLYERWGFTVVGEHPFDLGSDRQTDLVMARSLDHAPPAGAPRA